MCADQGRQEGVEARTWEQKGLMSTGGDRPLGAPTAEPRRSAVALGRVQDCCGGPAALAPGVKVSDAAVKPHLPCAHGAACALCSLEQGHQARLHVRCSGVRWTSLLDVPACDTGGAVCVCGGVPLEQNQPPRTRHRHSSQQEPRGQPLAGAPLAAARGHGSPSTQSSPSRPGGSCSWKRRLAGCCTPEPQIRGEPLSPCTPEEPLRWVPAAAAAAAVPLPVLK